MTTSTLGELEEVRFLAGKPSTDLISDTEIQFALAEEGNKYGAAALVCETLAGVRAGSADKTLGKKRVGSGAADAYAKRAQELRRRAAVTSPGTPYVGGVSIDGRKDAASDPDRIPARQDRWTHNHPGTVG